MVDFNVECRLHSLAHTDLNCDSIAGNSYFETFNSPNHSIVADLKDVNEMGRQLLKAHQDPDKGIDKLYGPTPLTSDRVADLFDLH